MIRVAIIDESPFVQRLLTAYLTRASGVHVIGAVETAEAALEIVEQSRPDVITLGIEMPDIKGTELLSLLKLASPHSAIVMVSGVSRRAAEMTLESLRKGADDFHLKFAADVPVEPQAWERELLAKVRAAKRRKTDTRPRRKTAPPAISQPVVSFARTSHSLLPHRIVVIGGSTGGIPAIERILAELDPSSHDAILVVQHLPAAFTPSLLVQLQARSSLPVTSSDRWRTSQPRRSRTGSRWGVPADHADRSRADVPPGGSPLGIQLPSEYRHRDAIRRGGHGICGDGGRSLGDG